MDKNIVQSIEDISNDLWESCNWMRGSVSQERYMYIVIGIIFLKNISDKFEKTMLKIKEEFPNNFENIIRDKDILSNYGSNFYVGEKSRWSYILQFTNQEVIKEKMDEAFELLERDNDKLKGLFEKNYNIEGLDSTRLSEILIIFNKYNFSEFQEDLIGRIYEYFLGNFFMKQGQDSGQFYTPSSIVKLMVDIVKPKKDNSIYDPAAGTGGMFIQSRQYLIDQQNNKTITNDNKNMIVNSLTIYGQEFEQTTWRLGQINLLINGFDSQDFNLGSRPEDTFKEDLHKNKQFDIILANPPFNLKNWTQPTDNNIDTFKWGIPPKNNANFAWLSLILSKLKSDGRAAVVLSNISLSSSRKQELEIRKSIIEENKVDAIINLPYGLFYTTNISACIWIFNNKKVNENILLIDAGDMGELKNRTWRILTKDNIFDISSLYEKHSKGEEVNVKSFAKTVNIEEIRENEYNLTPGRYIESIDENENISKEEVRENIVNLKEEMNQLLNEFTLLMPKANQAIEKILEEIKNNEN